MYQTLVIGAGQAGLAMGYYLQRLNQGFLIVDGAPELGHSWRTRWDSLTLFTPASHSALPGLPLPLPPARHPTKDEAADYVAQYAAHFALPVCLNTRITRLWRGDGRFIAEAASGERFTAEQVVIATGPFHTPNVPPFAADLDVFQVHSSGYRNPDQLPPGPVVVVGGANSAAQIAEELAPLRPVTLARRSVKPYVPGIFVSSLGFSLTEAFGGMDVNVESPLSRFVDTSGDSAVFGVNIAALRLRHGLEVRGEVTDAAGHTLVFEGHEAQQAQNVIWATGFKPDFSWVEVPVFDEQGNPCHRRGVTEVPGLYFLGLSWMWTRGSALIGWVGRDATYLARHIDAHALRQPV